MLKSISIRIVSEQIDLGRENEEDKLECVLRGLLAGWPGYILLLLRIYLYARVNKFTCHIEFGVQN